jgi:hypothetical protein
MLDDDQRRQAKAKMQWSNKANGSNIQWSKKVNGSDMNKMSWNCFEEGEGDEVRVSL